MIDRSQMGANIYNPNSKILRWASPRSDRRRGPRRRVQETMKRYMPDTWDDYQVSRVHGSDPARRV